ncbi:hypothetical protein [Terrabacter sp. NPDC080008]|uniref:hypothetical protein n=1 Tax=Terrabacter sp. NPDC080008 TaxID=3155176 RepID=UPI00344D6AE9
MAEAQDAEAVGDRSKPPWLNQRSIELRLDADTVYDLLVSRGLDDWLQPADFFDLARYYGPMTEEQYRSEAVALARRLLLEGHAVAGDIVDEEHRPWSGSVDDQLARVTALWSDSDVDPRFEFVWFDLTELGRRVAAEALDRLPDLG